MPFHLQIQLFYMKRRKERKRKKKGSGEKEAWSGRGQREGGHIVKGTGVHQDPASLSSELLPLLLLMLVPLLVHLSQKENPSLPKLKILECLKIYLVYILWLIYDSVHFKNSTLLSCLLHSVPGFSWSEEEEATGTPGSQDSCASCF